MAENSFNEPAKAKIVTTISNVALGDAEIGELFYDSATNRLYIRLVTGWKYIATNG